MLRMEGNAVLKYFEPIDAFIKIRLFTPEEVGRLLVSDRIGDKRSYFGLVLNACVIHYHDEILPRLKDRLGAEEQLYNICVAVNPSLDIRNVTIPVAATEGTEIHLLEQPKPANTRDLQALRHLEASLGEAVIGQDAAISSVSRAVKKAMTGLRDPQRPIATFLFVGQTGVGKTEMAKSLTLTLYHDPSKLVRIDCSEFALPHEYAKLIGAPPGYIGHDQGGWLAEAMRTQGSAVVLFDEVEKSDPKVHDLLLQMMDEGFVTDNKGRHVPFGEAILILTSNVGAQELEEYKNRAGFDAGRRRLERGEILDETLHSLKDRFKPEFLNRLTEVVLFNPIGLSECEKIVTRFLEEVRHHAESIPIRFRYGAHVPRFLAERGYKPEFGARELRRTVEKEVEGPLADLIIEGKVREGDAVEVRLSRDHLCFHRN